MPKHSDALLIYGASGHAKVVLDAAEQAGSYRIVGLLDDDPKLHGRNFCGYRILGGIEQLEEGSYERCELVIAVGSNEARSKLAGRLSELDYSFACVVHPSAQIGRGVSLGAGTVVMAGVVINPDTTVGEHVIVNTGATIDHDCVIGDFTHIAPGAHLAGGVRVGKLVHVGIGASVIQGVKIGRGAIIGAGAAVIADIPKGTTAVGVPAKVIKRREERGP